MSVIVIDYLSYYLVGGNMERGVVFTACELIKTEKNDGFQTGKGISAEEINYLVMYWDRLVSPTNNIIHIDINNEEELIKCGILVRPRFLMQGCFSGSIVADFHADTHSQVLNTLRKQEGQVDWRMHFLNEQVSLPQKESEERAVLRFELFNLLPVPTKETPLHEILEFKHRRSDELEALHGYLDELYSEVLSSGDFDLHRAKALSGLLKSIEDLNSINNHGWQSPLKFNLSSSFEFDLSQLVVGASTAYAAMQSQHPFEILTGAAIAAIGGAIKVRPQLQSVLKNGDPRLAYLTNAEKEGLLIK